MQLHGRQNPADEADPGLLIKGCRAGASPVAFLPVPPLLQAQEPARKKAPLATSPALKVNPQIAHQILAPPSRTPYR